MMNVLAILGMKISRVYAIKLIMWLSMDKHNSTGSLESETAGSSRIAKLLFLSLRSKIDPHNPKVAGKCPLCIKSCPATETKPETIRLWFFLFLWYCDDQIPINWGIITRIADWDGRTSERHGRNQFLNRRKKGSCFLPTMFQPKVGYRLHHPTLGGESGR